MNKVTVMYTVYHNLLRYMKEIKVISPCLIYLAAFKIELHREKLNGLWGSQMPFLNSSTQ